MCMLNLRTMMDGPIVTSLMHTDFYELTQGQLVCENYPDVQVEYRLTNRTKRVRLAEDIRIEELREQLEYVRTLRFNNSDLHYIRGTNEYGERMFHEPFLQFLRTMQFPEYELKEGEDGQLDLRFYGPWRQSIFSDTIPLTIISALKTRAHLRKLTRFGREAFFAEGIRRLREKIDLLKTRPWLTFSDFGTRRAAHPMWQDYLDGVLAEELPSTQFLGTSCVALAMKHGLLPMGTSSHGLPMVIAALSSDTDEGIFNTPRRVLEEWWKLYGQGLSIVLPDAFTSRAFYRDSMTNAMLAACKGSRQDSLDPFRYGEDRIHEYQKAEIDPTTKLIVFSDSLTVPKMFAINDRFRGRIKDTYGPGTHLTNDFPDIDTPSIVIKPYEANGKPCVKISDNPDKAIGPAEEIARYKRIFGVKDEDLTAETPTC